MSRIAFFLVVLEKLLFYEMDFEIYVFKNWLRNMVIEVFLKFRLELMN